MGKNIEEIKIEVQQTGAKETRKQLEEVERAQKKIQQDTTIHVKTAGTKKAVDEMVSTMKKKLKDSFTFSKSKFGKFKEKVKQKVDNFAEDKDWSSLYGDFYQYKKRFTNGMETLYESTKPLTRAITKLSNFFRRTFGEVMMFVGALMMVRNMAQRLYNTLVAVGNKFSDIEKKALVGSAYREKLYTKYGLSEMHEFERATQRRAMLTGESMAEAGMNLARAASEIEENGGKFSEKTLNSLTEAAFGSAALTGEEHLKVMKDILKIAREGKGTEKLGIGTIKLTKNIDENIRRIANEVKSNHIADAVIKYSTVGASVKSMGSSFDDLFDTVFHLHKTQISESFATAAQNMRRAFSDPEVVEVFEHLLTNLTDVMEKVFDEDRLKSAAIGAAKWGAIIIDASGKLADGIMWTFENSEKVLECINLAVKVWAIFKTIQFFAFTGEAIRGLFALKNGIAGFVTILTGAKVAGVGSALATLGGAITTVVGTIGYAATALAGIAATIAGAYYFFNHTEIGQKMIKQLHDWWYKDEIEANKFMAQPEWYKKMTFDGKYGEGAYEESQKDWEKIQFEMNKNNPYHDLTNPFNNTMEYVPIREPLQSKDNLPYFPDPDESILNKKKNDVDVIGNSYMSPNAKVILVNGNLGIMTDSPELENYILQNGGE